jgi:hypothetical protein
MKILEMVNCLYACADYMSKDESPKCASDLRNIANYIQATSDHISRKCANPNCDNIIGPYCEQCKKDWAS